MKHQTNSLFWLRLVTIVTAVSLSALFLYAAYNKLTIYSLFVAQLQESPITKGFQGTLAWLVPSIEILIVLLLLFKKTRLYGFYSSFFLMLIFSVYVFVLPHFFSDSVPCACGGIISTFTWKSHFIFNLAFTFLAGAGLVAYSFLLQRHKLTQ